MVYMYEKGYNILFKIHVFDTDLHNILPAGKLEFSFLDGLKIPDGLHHRKAQQLAGCIADEISQYLDCDEKVY